MGYFKQHRHQERTKEVTTITVPSTTQRIPMTERIILSRARTTPKTIITSTTTTEDRSTTEDINVIIEDYLKNIKGSRHFNRFVKNKTSMDEITISSTLISQEEIEDYTKKEILENTETTEESIGLATLPRDIVTNNIVDNDVASTSSSGPIISTTTPLKHVTIVDIIKDAMTSQSVKEAISDSTDEHYSSDKSEVDIVTNDVMTSTLSTQSKDLTSENSTKKYGRLRVGVDNIAFSTTPSLLTDIEESTSENSQFEATTNDIIISIRSDSGKDRDAENSTTKDLNHENFTAIQYNTTLINEIVTRESSPVTINYTSLMDEKFSTTTKVKSVIKI